MNKNKRIYIIQQVLQKETQALKELSNFSLEEQETLNQVIEEILKTKGKIAVVGLGKSGHIGKKISATFSSTGTPSFFLHPSELMHGDFGSLCTLDSTEQSKDIILLISNSGETKEIIEILPILKRLNLKIISITSNPNSTLGKYSDYRINIKIKEEACFLRLAPTTSTTTTLALGDAIAVALMQERNFSKEDFAKFHPGGSLGKKLLKIKNLMRGTGSIPVVYSTASYLEILEEISAKKLGFTCVIENHSRQLVGIITDGDLRRKQLEFKKLIFNKKSADLATKDPHSISEESLAEEALSKMQKYRISSLVVVSLEKVPIGIVDLKDILESRII